MNPFDDPTFNKEPASMFEAGCPACVSDKEVCSTHSSRILAVSFTIWSTAALSSFPFSKT